jgi:MoaA/NifB/PqqE/SkfB family radical SAM enzyme
VGRLLEMHERPVYLSLMRFRLPRRRPLAALQIEVTSRCTRACALCPRSVAEMGWRDGDLDEATWLGLEDDLRLARHVHLQGWGEPLLHPRLPEMAADVRAAGAQVGLTTNGDLLPGAVEWIVERKVDLVVISVAGAGAAHEALRAGSRPSEAWDAVGRLVERRGRGKRPVVKVSYLLTRESAEELPRAVEAAAEAGADELFAIHADVAPTREHLERAAIGPSGLRPGVREALEAARRAARGRRIAFRPPAAVPEEVLVCAYDPQSFLFVGWDGRVGPCVNLLLPVEGAIPRWTEEGPVRIEPVVFGRLADAPLREIVRGEGRRRFNEPLAARLAVEGRFRSVAEAAPGSVAPARVEEAHRLREEELAAHPLPPQCAGCHKALGW